jgi:hypothetical protein
VSLHVNDGWDRSRETWAVKTNGKHEYFFYRVHEWQPGAPRPGAAGEPRPGAGLHHGSGQGPPGTGPL